MKSRIWPGARAVSLFFIALSAAGCGDDASDEDASGGAGGGTASAAAGGTAGAGVGGAPGWSSECAAVVDQNALCDKSSSDDAPPEMQMLAGEGRAVLKSVTNVLAAPTDAAVASPRESRAA